MKKIIFLLTLTSLLVFSGCRKKAPKVFRIGSTTVAVNLLNNLKSDFKKAGLNIEIIEFSDYTAPNLALSRKQIDMNLFQHKPFLEAFNKSYNLNLSALDTILISPIGIYSKKVRNLKELKNGATIGIPIDISNLSRCLLVLQDANLIKLDSKKGTNVKIQDIIENKKHLRFRVEAASKLPCLLNEVDATFINKNFAISNGINISRAPIYREKLKLSYAEVIAIRKSDRDSEIVKKVVEIIKSDKTKEYLKKKYGKSIIATY